MWEKEKTKKKVGFLGENKEGKVGAPPFYNQEPSQNIHFYKKKKT